MTQKKLPFTKEQIAEIMQKYPTPFHIYDEAGIRGNARRFKKAFSILPGFKEFFAVKALPNPFIMKILKIMPNWLYFLILKNVDFFSWKIIDFKSKFARRLLRFSKFNS